MSKKIKFLILMPVLLLFLSACGANTSTSSGLKKDISKKLTEEKMHKKEEGITALKAWEKVKKEAEKWSKNYKIARIEDSSYANFKRQNGKADVWKFVLEDCREMYTSMNLCRKGKTKDFYYSITKGGWGEKGVSSKDENNMPSGHTAFSAEELKIDTDKAVELALKKLGQKKNEMEEFIIEAFATEKGGIYWNIRRQCFRGGGDECNRADNFSLYVNVKTGEVLEKKPR